MMLKVAELKRTNFIFTSLAATNETFGMHTGQVFQVIFMDHKNETATLVVVEDILKPHIVVGFETLRKSFSRGETGALTPLRLGTAAEIITALNKRRGAYLASGNEKKAAAILKIIRSLQID